MAPRRCPHTLDLLSWEAPPTPVVPAFPPEVTRVRGLYDRVVLGMKAAIDESGKDRATICRDMGDFLGQPVTEAGLDAALSQARTSHVINVVRYAALARATEDARLIGLLAAPLDHVVVPRRFVPFIEIGMLSEAGAEIDRRLRQARRAAGGGR
jgi:hypothetical protein